MHLPARRSGLASLACIILCLGGCRATAATPPPAPGTVVVAAPRATADPPTSSLDFVVLDTDARPVAGIDVWTGRTMRTSAADGTLRFDALPPGEHFVHATAGPVAPALVAIVRTPLSGRLPIVVGGVAEVVGRVTRSGSGEPVAGADVIIEVESHSYWFPDRGHVTTDAGGYWRARVLAGRPIRGIWTEGTTEESSPQPRRAPRTGEAFRVDCVVEAQPPDTVRSVPAVQATPTPDPPRVRFHGRVGGTNGAVAWVQVERRRVGTEASRWAHPVWRAAAADGTFEFTQEFDAERAGRVRLRALCDGHALTTSAPSEFAASATEITADVELAPGRMITGRVTSADGVPIAGAVIALEDRELADRGPDMPEFPAPIVALTSADGMFRLEHVEPTWTHAEVSAPGFVTAERDLTPGPVDARLDAALHPATVLRGRIVHADGSPVPGADLEVFVGADADLPPPRRHAVPAAAQDEDDELDEAAFLAAQAVAAAEDAAAAALDAERRRHAVPDSAESAPDGTFEIAGVAADGWTLRIGPGGGDDASPRFFVHRVRGTSAPGAPIEIVIPAAPRITGRVEWPDGAPVAGAFVTIHEPDEHGRAFVLLRTDADGRFDAPSPAEGPVRIDVEPRGGKETAFRDIAPGAKNLVLRLSASR